MAAVDSQRTVFRNNLFAASPNSQAVFSNWLAW